MVLRDATSDKMVDCSHGGHLGVGTMSYRDTIPTILQLPDCLCQIAILATRLDISLFRPFKSGSFIPCLFLAAILTSSGRIVRSFFGSIRLVTGLCHDFAARFIAFSFFTLSRNCALLQSGLYLGATKSRGSIEFLGSSCFHGTILALGINGV